MVRVTGWEPRPLALRTLLNQTASPAGILVPLKLEVMMLVAEGWRRSSNASNEGRRLSAAGGVRGRAGFGPRRPDRRLRSQFMLFLSGRCVGPRAQGTMGAAHDRG